MKSNITDILNACGIKNIGFCDFNLIKNRLLDCRAKNRLPQNAKTVIMCAFPYKVNEQPPEFLSRYAAVADYHIICTEMLGAASRILKEKYPQNAFEHFCDNSPIPEVYAAAASGIGVKGDNGLLITKKYGSFVFLGEIVTDLELSCQNNYGECLHCGKCSAACPVSLEKSICLSNISQKKKVSDSELQTLKAHKILWGCDICANICPMNKNAKTTDIEFFKNGYRNTYTADEDSKDRPYTWRGDAGIKRNYENLKKQL